MASIATGIEINPESRERIRAAASQLYEQGGRQRVPSVDAVRKLAGANMNDVSVVMKEWRAELNKAQSVPASPVPEQVLYAAQQLVSALWADAEALATEGIKAIQVEREAERAEAEQLRTDIAVSYDRLAAELEKTKGDLSQAVAHGAAQDELAAQLRELSATEQSARAVAEARAAASDARLDETQKRVGSLEALVEQGRSDLERSRQALEDESRRNRVDLQAERQKHANEVSAAKSEYASHVERLSQDLDELRAAHAHTQKLSTDALEACRKGGEALQRALEGARGECQAALERAANLTGQVKTLEDQLEGAKGECQAALERAGVLNGQVKALEEQLAKQEAKKVPGGPKK